MAHSGAEIFFLSLQSFLLCVLQPYFCWLALLSENIHLVPQVDREGKGCFMVNEETSGGTAFRNVLPPEFLDPPRLRANACALCLLDSILLRSEL